MHLLTYSLETTVYNKIKNFSNFYFYTKSVERWWKRSTYEIVSYGNM